MQNSKSTTYVLLKSRFAKLSATLLLMLPFAVLAQCDAPEVPERQTFEVASDYRACDAKASDALVWLLEHDLDECQEEREYLNAFVLVWLSGHPDVIVDASKASMPFIKSHPELLYPMLHGMALYHLQRGNLSIDPVEAHVAGLSAVVDVAGRVEPYRSDDTMKELRRARRRDKLDDWLSERSVTGK